MVYGGIGVFILVFFQLLCMCEMFSYEKLKEKNGIQDVWGGNLSYCHQVVLVLFKYS